MDHDDDSNAHWLYWQCSDARTEMETPLSAMQLSIQVLKFIKSIDEDDDQVTTYDIFKVLKEDCKAPKRDLSFVFKLCERAIDLRDDKELCEEALLANAANDKEGEASGEIEDERNNVLEKLRGKSADGGISADVVLSSTDASAESVARQQLAHAGESSETTNNATGRGNSTNLSCNDEDIKFDDMHCFQLRTRVLGLNEPTFKELWGYLQTAGWTHSHQKGYQIPKNRKGKFRHGTDGMAKRIYNHFNLDNASIKNEMKEEAGEESDEEEGPESFCNPNDLVDYLDEFCMPDYRATTAEIQAQSTAFSAKSKAYQRRCKRLRFELLEIAYCARVQKSISAAENEEEKQRDDSTSNNEMKSKYGHNHRPCEVCFKGSNQLYPRVACRDCGLVVHTYCYGLLDHGEKGADNRSNSATKVDEKGFFTCDACASSPPYGGKKKLRWHASQSSGWRQHQNPNMVCPLCDRQDITGAMVRIIVDDADAGASEKKKTRKRKSRRSGESSEIWAHLFCVNSLPSTPFAPGSIRSSDGAVLRIHEALDHAAKVIKETDSMRETSIGCESCGKHKGDLVECKGTCGRFWHRLCLQIDVTNVVGLDAKKEHKCIQCRNMDIVPSKEDNGAVAPSFIGSSEAKTANDQKKISAKVQQNKTTTEVDQYFERKSGKKSSTTEEVKSDLIVPLQQDCIAEVESLYEDSNVDIEFDGFEVQYEKQFREWSFSMATNQSILLYGLGSKACVLTSFSQFLSAEGDVVSLNGFDPKIDLNQFLDYMDQLFCEYKQSDPQPAEGKNHNSVRDLNKGLARKAASVAKRFKLARTRPLFILIHNIDGVGMRNRFAQEALAILTTSSRKDGSPLIRIAASVDNVNASICLWSPQVEHKFDWAWKKVHTYRPYFDEVRHLPQMEATKKAKKSAGKQKYGSASAVLKVLAYLAPRHTEVLQLLASMQLKSASKTVPYGSWMNECLKKMLTASDTNLRTIMKELFDHKMIGSDKDSEGIEQIFVPSSIPLEDILNFKPKQQ